MELMIFVKVAILLVFLSWVPGHLLLRALRISLPGNRTAALFLPFVFGIPLISFLYLLARLTGHARIVLVFPSLALFLNVFFWIREGFPRPSGHFSREEIRDLLIFLFLFGVVAGLGFSYSSRTFYDPAGGYVIGDGAYSDNIWGVSVTAELRHHVPPRLPLLAGYRLRYHYLGDLFSELLYRLSGTKMTVLDFNFRYEPPFFILILFGILYAGIKYSFRSSTIAFLSIALLALAPLRTPLFFKHHSTLALAYFFAGTSLLLTAFEQNKKGKPFLYGAFLLIGLLPLYDGTFGLVTNGTFLLYGWVDSFRKKRVSEFLIANLVGLGIGITIYVISLGWPGGHATSLTLGNGPQWIVSRQRFKHVTWVLKFLAELIPITHTSIRHWVMKCVKGIYDTLCLILSLFIPPKEGPLRYHFLAIPFLYSLLRYPKQGERTWRMVAWIAVSCILFSIFVAYKKGPGTSVTLRAIEFAQMILMPFTAWVVASLAIRGRWRGWILLGFVFFVYVFPGYYRYSCYVKPVYYSYVDRDTIELLNFVKEKTPPSSVIVHPFQDNPIYRVGEASEKPAWLYEGHYFFLSALGERQAVFEGAATSTTYYMGDASHEEVVARMNEVAEFYQTQDKGWAQNFLSKYGVTYVWMPRIKPLQFNSTELLVPVLENQKHILYKVTRPTP